MPATMGNETTGQAAGAAVAQSGGAQMPIAMSSMPGSGAGLATGMQPCACQLKYLFKHAAEVC